MTISSDLKQIGVEHFKSNTKPQSKQILDTVAHELMKELRAVGARGWWMLRRAVARGLGREGTEGEAPPGLLLAVDEGGCEDEEVVLHAVRRSLKMPGSAR